MPKGESLVINFSFRLYRMALICVAPEQKDLRNTEEQKTKVQRKWKGLKLKASAEPHCQPEKELKDLNPPVEIIRFENKKNRG